MIKVPMVDVPVGVASRHVSKRAERFGYHIVDDATICR
jgi:hypothetical protein